LGAHALTRRPCQGRREHGLGITAQDLRADRLHDEAQASGGDPLRLAHLFGISDQAAIRYCAELGPPGGVPPDDPDDQARRTWHYVRDAGRADRRRRPGSLRS
jgi:hypothetical protein